MEMGNDYKSLVVWRILRMIPPTLAVCLSISDTLTKNTISCKAQSGIR